MHRLAEVELIEYLNYIQRFTLTLNSVMISCRQLDSIVNIYLYLQDVKTDLITGGLVGASVQAESH